MSVASKKWSCFSSFLILTGLRGRSSTKTYLRSIIRFQRWAWREERLQYRYSKMRSRIARRFSSVVYVLIGQRRFVFYSTRLAFYSLYYFSTESETVVFRQLRKLPCLLPVKHFCYHSWKVTFKIRYNLSIVKFTWRASINWRGWQSKNNFLVHIYLLFRICLKDIFFPFTG